MLNLIHS